MIVVEEDSSEFLATFTAAAPALPPVVGVEKAFEAAGESC
jgi:hypothetical protein